MGTASGHAHSRHERAWRRTRTLATYRCGSLPERIYLVL